MKLELATSDAGSVAGGRIGPVPSQRRVRAPERQPLGCGGHHEPGAFGDRQRATVQLEQAQLLAVEGSPVPGLRVRVDHAHCQLALDDRRQDAREGKPQAELGVEHIVEVLAEEAELVEEIPAPERRRLRPADRIEHPAVSRRRRELGVPDLGHVALLVHEAGSSREPSGPRAREGLDGRVKCARKVVVVGVDVGDDLPGRPSESLVQRVRLPIVGLAGPPRESVGVALDDLDGTVGRAAVHDHVLEVRVALVEHRTQRSLEEGRLIERRRDDRQLRPHGFGRRTNNPSE
jgi:hypothetical protein